MTFLREGHYKSGENGHWIFAIITRFVAWSNDSMEREFWPPHFARLRLAYADPESRYNWLFLPGGPGLGSESLLDLIALLDLPVNCWQLDLPGDGSNIIACHADAFANWQIALIEAVSAFRNIVLVAHSTGGMYALAMPALEAHLSGLILMDSAPNSAWQQEFAQYVSRHPLPPSNAKTLNELTLAAAPYLFNEQGMAKGLALLEKLPFNAQSCAWSAEHFDNDYEAKWVPKHLPTLILAGAEDHLTPISLFEKNKTFQRQNILIRTIAKAGHYP